MSRARVTAFALLAVLAAGPAAAAAPQELGFVPHAGARVSEDLTFLDEGGARVRFSELTGGRSALVFLTYHHCPNLCPILRDNLASSLAHRRASGPPQTVLVVSIDPTETFQDAHDQGVLFRGRYSSPGDGGWKFLVGDSVSARQLAEEVGFRYAPNAQGGLDHSLGVVVLSPSGIVSDYLPGVEPSRSQLADAIGNAGAGRIDRGPFRLAASVCRPLEEESSAAARWTLLAVRSASIATVLAVGAMIVLLVRRERGVRARRD